MEKQKMYCPYCKKEREGNFCLECGARLTEKPSVEFDYEDVVMEALRILKERGAVSTPKEKAPEVQNVEKKIKKTPQSDEENGIYVYGDEKYFTGDRIRRAYCNKIKKCIIPEGTTEIGDIAFCDCTNLESVDIPDSVIAIGVKAFRNCSSLKSIEIPSAMEFIPEETFWGCEKLETVTIKGDDILGLEEGLSSLLGNQIRNIILCKGVTEIPEWAFADFNNITSIVIPESVTKIGDCAFARCPELSSVSFPSSLKSIGKYAFEDTILKSVSIPRSTEVEANAFPDDCEILRI